MTDPDRESHWATVLGCDMRAVLGEIERAANRRTREVVAGPLRGEALASKLRDIGEALDAAKREKRTEKRRSAGSRRFQG